MTTTSAPFGAASARDAATRSTTAWAVCPASAIRAATCWAVSSEPHPVTESCPLQAITDRQAMSTRRSQADRSASHSADIGSA
ncbi:hypothetical protein B1L11_16380 [Microbispora sp. GKU 823]|nr:hypothetical protein [Microbispora sp. GKU 823]OPG12097.1 hypothetical protein B1L11_16380 [Microbispora sp. GKU 823]